MHSSSFPVLVTEAPVGCSHRASSKHLNPDHPPVKPFYRIRGREAAEFLLPVVTVYCHPCFVDVRDG